MYRSKVELMDAIFVVKLIGTGHSFKDDTGGSFPEDPIATYQSEGIHYWFLQNLNEIISSKERSTLFLLITGRIILRTIGLEQLENLL